MTKTKLALIYMQGSGRVVCQRLILSIYVPWFFMACSTASPPFMLMALLVSASFSIVSFKNEFERLNAILVYLQCEQAYETLVV